VCDCRRGFGLDIGCIDHYTHHSELTAIIAPPLISTLHNSLANTLSLFQPFPDNGFNSRDSSSSALKSSLNCGSLPTLFQLFLRIFPCSQSQSYVTADGQSASLSWCQAPIWGLRPDLHYCQTVAGFIMWIAVSNEKTGLRFTVAAGPRRRSHSWVLFPRDS
jgi:hypothetical protein